MTRRSHPRHPPRPRRQQTGLMPQRRRRRRRSQPLGQTPRRRRRRRPMGRTPRRRRPLRRRQPTGQTPCRRPRPCPTRPGPHQRRPPLCPRPLLATATSHWRHRRRSPARHAGGRSGGGAWPTGRSPPRRPRPCPRRRPTATTRPGPTTTSPRYPESLSTMPLRRPRPHRRRRPTSCRATRPRAGARGAPTRRGPSSSPVAGRSTTMTRRPATGPSLRHMACRLATALPMACRLRSGRRTRGTPTAMAPTAPTDGPGRGRRRWTATGPGHAATGRTGAAKALSARGPARAARGRTPPPSHRHDSALAPTGRAGSPARAGSSFWRAPALE